MAVCYLDYEVLEVRFEHRQAFLGVANGVFAWGGCCLQCWPGLPAPEAGSGVAGKDVTQHFT